MTLPRYGQGGDGAGDYANILNMISSGYGNQVTPFDIGLSLGPQQVGQAFQQGWGQLNDTKNRALKAAIETAADEVRRQQIQSQSQQHADTIGLGYAKMPHERELAELRNQGAVGAAAQKGQADWMKTVFGERGKNERAARRDQLLQERNRIQDKPPAWKPDSNITMDLWSKAAADAAASQGKLTQAEAFAARINQLQMSMAQGSSQAKQAFQGKQPPQPPSGPAQVAAPPVGPTPADYRPLHERLLGITGGQGFDTAPSWY